MEQPWPGNVRELENLLERTLILAPEGAAELEPPRADSRRPVRPLPSATATFDQAVRCLLEETLAACQGRIYGPGGAAERLGLRPTTLQSKLRRLGVRGRRGG